MARNLSHHRRGRPAARVWHVAALAALVLLHAGCSFPKPIRTYEFILHHDRMSDSFEPVVSLVYIAENADPMRYKNIVIGAVTVGEQRVEDRPQAARYATYLRALLRNMLVESGRFQVVTLDRSEAFPTLTLRLEAMVTKFDFGSGKLRYWGWFLPLFQSKAASDFQIEGRLTDAQSGAVLIEFADRRRHLGNTPFGPNPKTFRDDFVMKHTVRETTRAVSAFIQQVESGELTAPMLEMFELESEDE